MSWTERLQQFKDGNQRKIQEVEEQRAIEIEVVNRAINDCQIEKKLKEINKELWGMGEVERRTNWQQVEVDLLAKWPTYYGWDEYQRLGYDDSMTRVQFEEVGRSRALIFVTAMMASNMNNIYTNERWDGNSVAVVFNGSYDGPSRHCTYDSYDHPNMSLFDRPEVGFGDENRIILTVGKPVNDGDLKKVDDMLTRQCVYFEQKLQYPLTVRAQKDRQEIVEKVLSGNLSPNHLPRDFGAISQRKQ